MKKIGYLITTIGKKLIGCVHDLRNDLINFRKMSANNPSALKTFFKKNFIREHWYSILETDKFHYWTFEDGDGYDVKYSATGLVELKSAIGFAEKNVKWTGNKSSNKVPEHVMMYLQMDKDNLPCGIVAFYINNPGWKASGGSNCGFSGANFPNERFDDIVMILGTKKKNRDLIHFYPEAI